MKSPDASRRAADTMLKTIQLLKRQPQMGRPTEDMDPEYRELPIRFGSSGYVAIYHIRDNQVTILGIRHQKEAGYNPSQPL